MVAFTHILVPIDFSEFSARSLSHAAALARWYDARLTVLHVGPAFDPLLAQGELGLPIQGVNLPTPEKTVGEMQRWLDVGGMAPGAVPVARLGDASTTIVEEAIRDNADLIVMGTHGRRGFKRFLLGSVTERVLREAPCPVLTVPARAPAGSSDIVTFKRILCPTDFSPSAALALQFALNLARQADGAVTVLHGIEWLAEEEPRTRTYANMSDIRQRLLEESKKQMDDLVAAESQTWSRIDSDVVFGRVYREILRAADARQSELIVMGAQGRGGLDLAVFGSTTQQVVRGASCPVLTVRGVGSSGAS